MAYCSQCGAPLEGAFCSRCGAARATSGRSASGPLEDHVAGALCYSLGPLTGVAFLLIEPYNKNRQIRFHAFQSIFLSAGCLLIYYGIGILLPFGLRLAIAPFIMLASMAVWLYVMWRTYQKDRLVLPIVGPMAEKQL
jgi:uncharacterized membrane protein